MTLSDLLQRLLALVLVLLLSPLILAIALAVRLRLGGLFCFPSSALVCMADLSSS